jgi:uncharacterized SAM-binding protein YcdF (DUF218 family)
VDWRSQGCAGNIAEVDEVREKTVILPIILLLLLVALIGSRLRWRKTAWAFLILGLAVLVSIGCGPVAGILLHDLQASYSGNAVIHPAHSTAIILLGNGTERFSGADGVSLEPGPLAYGRISKALELYRACKQMNSACMILVSGGDPQHHGASEASVYGALLQRLGVEPADLLLETRSRNTWENARYSADLLKLHPAEQVFLVTSAVHLRRSVLYFARFGVHGQPVRADWVSAGWSVIPSAYNFLVTDLALHEYVGLWRYRVYEAMGWNTAA